jgi:tRNA A22 N-methylase
VQERNIAWYSAHPEEIETRLAELDAEIDIDRAMDVYALRASVAGGVLSVLRSRGWALVPLAAAGMLALQSATGDSALRRFLRKRGYRTATEIAAEEDALFALLDAQDAKAAG